MTSTKLNSKSQITLPRSVRQALGLAPGDAVEFIVQADGFKLVAAPREPMQKLDLGKLSFPYAWSNPNLSHHKVVAAVIDRGMFGDLCKLALQIGVPAIRAAHQRMKADPERDVAIRRMMRNIEIGLATDNSGAGVGGHAEQ